MNEFARRISKKISKLSEEQLERLMRNLYAENDTLSATFGSLRTGLVIAGTDWRVTRANRAAERLLSIPAHADFATERPFAWDCAGEAEICQFLKSSAEGRKTNVSKEFTTATSGGNVRFVTVSVLPLVGAGEFCGLIICAEDVTSRRSQEIQLRRMESLAGLTTLAASMAHDIKNPLGAMGIQLQLLEKAVRRAREDGVLPEEKFLEQKIGIIGEEIARLEKIVTEFQFAAKPVQSRLELLNMDRVVKKFVEFFEPELNSKGIALEVGFPSEQGQDLVLADEKLTREFCGHLMQNAMYAIGRKREQREFEARICVGSSRKEGKYVLVFEDNGCGMDSETLSHIFEPYFTTKASGTGLGMTMVYKIVKEFGGDLSVDSVPNEGTRLTVALPLPQTDTKCLEGWTE